MDCSGELFGCKKGGFGVKMTVAGHCRRHLSRCIELLRDQTETSCENEI